MEAESGAVQPRDDAGARRARLQGERGALAASVAQVKGRIAEIQLKILQIDEDLRTEVGKELAEIRGKRAELSERRIAAEDQLRRIDLLAPQDGRVFQRSVHTVGGVVQAGEAAHADRARRRLAGRRGARAAPHEIDQVHVGQKAALHFSAFQRTTPELDGEVVHVAADAAQDERTGEHYYVARIRVADGELARLDGAALARRHAGRGLHPDGAAHRRIVSRQAARRPGRPGVPWALAAVSACLFLA